MRLQTTFTPADFEALAQTDLSETTCVVFDILRATSSMVTALANRAERIRPVATIEEALEQQAAHPDARVWMCGLLLQRFFNCCHRPDTFRAIGQRRHHAAGSPQDIEHDTGGFG